MIAIETIYVRTQQDLSRLGKSGYTSSDEFNRDVVDAQAILMSFYTRLLDVNTNMPTALGPFIKEVVKPLDVNGYTTLPADYRRWTDVSMLLFDENDTDCDDIDKAIRTPVYYLRTNEEYNTSTSPIRKNNQAKGVWSFTLVNNGIRILGANAKHIYLKYITKPPIAKRGYTVNVTTDREDYNAATSIDLIWPDEEANNLVDIILYYKGIQIRETALLEWLNAKKLTEP